MAKSNNSSDAVVTDLLAERNKYQTWITRLDSTKDTTPAAVRSKVLADYQAKLEGVIERLTQHGDAVREQLEQRKIRKDELMTEEAKSKETLAEAELRHAVGEYDEGDWTKVRADMNKVLVGTREELAKVVEDIERLAEVAKLIAAPPPPEPKPEPKPAPKAEPAKAEAPKAAAAEPGTSSRRESGRVEFIAPDTKAKPPADELEFLRATVGEEAAAASALPKPTKIEREKKPKAEPTPAPAATAEPLPEPKGTPEVRTLKCPECGTMNRPTEWYCERCGSELAGV